MAKSSIQQNKADCYVYAIVVNGIVRYIGKGSGDRAWRHLRIAAGINRRRDAGKTVKARKFYNKLAKVLRSGAVVESHIIISHLSSEAAFDREIAEIASAPCGQLWNELSGGQGLSSEDAKRIWTSPEFRAKLNSIRSTDEFRQRAREGTIAHFKNPEARQRSQAASKALWSDPAYRDRGTRALQSIWQNAEIRERHKMAIAKAWEENPERRIARAEITRSYSSRPGYAERTSKRFKTLWKDSEFRKNATAHWTNPERKRAIIESWTPEFLRKRGRAIAEGQARSEAMKTSLADPARIQKLTVGNKHYWAEPEARMKQSLKMKALWADPEYRAKTTAHWAEKRKAKDGRP